MAGVNAYKILEYVFTPQISSAYWFILLYARLGIGDAFPLIVVLVFASAVQLLSLAVYLQMRRSGFSVSDRSARFPLFVVSIASYLCGFAVLSVWGGPFVFKALMLAYVINTVLAALITKFLTKISIHTWGISGPSVAIFYVYGYAGFAIMLLLAALVGYSRVRLNEHTVTQVASAVVISVLLTFGVIYGLAPYV